MRYEYDDWLFFRFFPLRNMQYEFVLILNSYYLCEIRFTRYEVSVSFSGVVRKYELNFDLEIIICYNFYIFNLILTEEN